MYRDVEQWAKIRYRVLRKGVSIRQVVRETGIGQETVRKMLDHPLPKPYGPRIRKYPKLGPYMAAIQRILRNNASMPPAAHLSVKAIYECIRDNQRAQARQAAFEWMRAVLQRDIGLDALRRAVGDGLDLTTLLQRLYDGRLSDRNRSMAVLASRHGLSSGIVCSFLGIDKRTHRTYLRTFEDGGQDALFARRQSESTRKYDNEAVKQAVFALLHEPPSNYGINRTTWIMPDLSRVLCETGLPACPEVIRRITKAAGYRWRKARVVLTSSDPDYSEKLDRIRSILSGLHPEEAFFSIDEFGPFAVKMTPGRAPRAKRASCRSGKNPEVA
jgi:transposase